MCGYFTKTYGVILMLSDPSMIKDIFCSGISL